MSGIVFQKWKALEEHIIKTTGCKPFSGAGINPRVNKKTTILRSVDDTDYYDDDLSDLNCIKYTLLDTMEIKLKTNQNLIIPF